MNLNKLTLLWINKWIIAVKNVKGPMWIKMDLVAYFFAITLAVLHY